MSATPNLLTIAEAAEACRVSTRTVHRWIADGALEIVTLPSGRPRISREALDAMLLAPDEDAA